MNNILERFDSMVYEISNKKSQGGKRSVKLILHEIFPDDTTWQNNGISWKEEYVLKALESLKNAPIAVEFIDSEKKEIWGHGLTDEIETSTGRIPIFEDSEVIGSFVDGYIDDVKIDGEVKRVLVGNGYIYEQRCPHFVEWLVENVPQGNVKGSVEITGLPENENKIIYEDGFKEEGRVPQEYLYSGHVILSHCVAPADESAIVLEINHKKFKESEENTTMDEKVIEKIVADVKSAIVETNSKNEEYEAQITEYKTKVSELNASVEELTKALDDVTKERDNIWEKQDILYKEAETLKDEIAKAKVKERIEELNSALSDFTDEEKAYAKDEIEKFNANPMEYEVNTIVTKINAEIGKKAKAEKIEAQRVAEQNAKKTDVEDIFGEVFETNSKDKEDTEIF